MIHAVFHKICEIERSKKAKMTFKVTKGRRYWCHIRCRISLLLQLCLYLASFPGHVSQNWTRLRESERISFGGNQHIMHALVA